MLGYTVLTGAIIPRPIGFISSISASGHVNLAPFSFFNAVCGEPPMVIFAPMNRTPPKDTLLNVKATGEFVANIVSEEIAEQMNTTSGDYPPDVNEFDVAKLTALPSVLVKPPRVAESPVNMECKVKQIIELSDKPWGGHLVIGEVLLFHVRDEIIADPVNLFIDPDKLAAIGRMGGPQYSKVHDRIEMIRPVVR